MQELKSVRIFSELINSISNKVTLYKLEDLNFKVNIDLNGKLYTYNYNDNLYPVQKKELFNNLIKQNTDNNNLVGGFNINNLTQYDYFINESILNISKLLNVKFNISQDPWLINVSRKRNYGYDPYYLNNSCVVYINWFVNNERVGGSEWSDVDGVEKDFFSLSTDKENITKKVFISTPDSNKFTIGVDNKITNIISNSKVYPYNAKDDFILDEIIRIWKLVVSNYDLGRCSNLPCNALEYKSPLEPNENINYSNEEVSKRNMQFILPNEVKIRSDFRLIVKVI